MGLEEDMLLHCMEQQGSLITLCDEMKLLCCGFTKSCRGFDVGFDEDMLLHCMEQQGSFSLRGSQYPGDVVVWNLVNLMGRTLTM